MVAEHPDLPNFEARSTWTIRLPSGIRHIGIEVRFSLRHQHAGIDIWFWRDASLPIWEHIHASQTPYNELVNAEWAFEQVDGRSRARMFVNCSVTDLRNESSWPEVYRWLGEKLLLVYAKVMPKLREEMDQNEAASA
jgi:hypothetical protein